MAKDSSLAKLFSSYPLLYGKGMPRHAVKPRSKIKPVLQRNDQLYDGWSIVHILTGMVLGWVMSPVVAIVVMIAWEPLELFVVSPFAVRRGVIFGYETWRNSLSDIVFDALGVAIGAIVLTLLLTPPFYLF